MSMDGFWILWSPQGETNPKVKFLIYEDAMSTAETMAKRHFPQPFYVCKAESVAVAKDRPVSITKLSTPRRPK